MRFLFLVMSVSFLMALNSCGNGKNADKTNIRDVGLIQTAQVSYRNLIQQYETFGTAHAAKKADIVSYTKGVIIDIWVKNGQKVEKGQKLLSVEGFYKIRDRETNQLEGIDKNSDIVKRASIDGYISSLKKYSGNKVGEGETLLSVIDLKNLIVRTEVFDNDVTIKVGQKARIISGMKAFDGAVASVAFDVNPKTGGRTIEIQLIHPEPPEILAGEFVKVVFISEHNNVLSIPKSALLNENGNAVVVIKIKNGYRKKLITVGISSKGYLEVLSGLKENEIVVTTGAYELLNQNINEKIKIED